VTQSLSPDVPREEVEQKFQSEGLTRDRRALGMRKIG
jgi:hypothetical protein